MYGWGKHRIRKHNRSHRSAPGQHAHVAYHMAGVWRREREKDPEKGTKMMSKSPHSELEQLLRHHPGLVGAQADKLGQVRGNLGTDRGIGRHPGGLEVGDPGVSTQHAPHAHTHAQDTHSTLTAHPHITHTRPPTHL